MKRAQPGQPGAGDLARLVIDRTIALSGIPAPPRREQERARVVRAGGRPTA